MTEFLARLEVQHLATMLGFGLAVLLLVRILRQREHPSTTIAWIMAIVLIPHLGVPAYLIFGGRKLRKMADRKEHLYPDVTDPKDAVEKCTSDNERVLVTAGLPPARKDNHCELLPDGETAYRELCDQIDGAKHSVHIMTFILGKDEVGRDLIARLARKAESGVKVRLLLDALGCLWTRGRFVNPLRHAGGHVGVFMPMLPLQRKWSANLRNHRKLAVFDSSTAFLGGMNIAREYMGPEPDADRWIDTGMLLRGPIVGDIDWLFQRDWRFAVGQEIEPHEKAEVNSQGDNGEAIAQLGVSGPDVDGDPLYDALLTSMHDAVQRVWIVTPYFVPDEGLYKALALQARLGRDVRIILPEHSNHILADWARGRFLRQLQEDGARILFHPTRMIHAKQIVIDDWLAVSGSANLDFRSLYLNYEVAVFLYSPPEVKRTADWIEQLSRECVDAQVPQPGHLRQWAEDLSWLVSPLL
ncbi:MAG: cardiolipin synthase [Candidatus Hydrogenedentota bacterium]